MKLPLTIGFALLAATAVSAQAEPLAFGALNGTGRFAKSADIGGCTPDSGDDRSSSCRLQRTSFGGLPIKDSRVTLNAGDQVRSIAIVLDRRDADMALRLLQGRYGEPASTAPIARWSRFDDGATITLRTSVSDAVVAFDFPSNEASPGVAQPPLTAIAATLLFAGVLAGLMLLMRWKARRPVRAAAQPIAEPSMRAALERRIQQGQGLSF